LGYISELLEIKDMASATESNVDETTGLSTQFMKIVKDSLDEMEKRISDRVSKEIKTLTDVVQKEGNELSCTLKEDVKSITAKMNVHDELLNEIFQRVMDISNRKSTSSYEASKLCSRGPP
jgi:uncharacterized protein YicC (UPF0701 family)